MNKKLLYETIMRNVSKEVKKALNETVQSQNFSDTLINYVKYINSNNLEKCLFLYKTTNIKYKIYRSDQLVDIINLMLSNSKIYNANNILNWIDYEGITKDLYYAIFIPGEYQRIIDTPTLYGKDEHMQNDITDIVPGSTEKFPYGLTYEKAQMALDDLISEIQYDFMHYDNEDDEYVTSEEMRDILINEGAIMKIVDIKEALDFYIQNIKYIV